MIIAIDGHSSCGKSTTAKALAKRLSLPYVDTGAMYRAITLYVLDNNIATDDHSTIIANLPHITVQITNHNGQDRVMLNGIDVSEEIRSLRVSNKVSEIAVIAEVRAKLVALQRAMAANGLVMDGRDIGSVVFPNADFKFFVTAEVNERARRRYLELLADGKQVTLEEVKNNLIHRDQIDSNRVESPLKQVPDAILIDTTELNLNEQNELIYQYVVGKR